MLEKYYTSFIVRFVKKALKHAFIEEYAPCKNDLKIARSDNSGLYAVVL